MTWDREKSASGGIRNHSCSNLHTFVLEDLCWNLVTKVPEDLSFVLEDLCLNPDAIVLEYHPFVLEDSWLNPCTLVPESCDIRA